MCLTPTLLSGMLETKHPLSQLKSGAENPAVYLHGSNIKFALILTNNELKSMLFSAV